MRGWNDLIGTSQFWCLIVGIVLGILIAWRFARALERFRDAVGHALHHWQRAHEFVVYARDGIGSLLATGAVFLLTLVALGGLVYWKVAG